MPQLLRTILLAAGLQAAWALPALAASKRPLTVDDLFNLQQIGDVAISPDGAEIAVVVKRARTAAERYTRRFLQGNDRADVFLLARAGGPARNLTHGVQDGSGYWNPVWSPDGQRLALLSTKGNDNVRLYVWEKQSGQLKRLTERGVDLYADTFGVVRAPVTFLWLNARQLICAVLPEGRQPTLFNIELQTQQIAPREWQKIEKGMEATASILESGIEVPEAARPLGQLLQIDAASGQATVLATGNFRHVLLSPDKRYLGAIADTGPVPPTPTRPLRFDFLRHAKVGIITLGDKLALRWCAEVTDPKIVSPDVPHAWSPDSSALAVIARADKRAERPESVFLIAPADGAVRRIGPGTLKVANLAWSHGNDLLAYGAAAPVNGTDPSERIDWWLLDRSDLGGAPRNLTASLPTAPAGLLRTFEPKSMVGWAGGKLWNLDLAAARAVELSTKLPGKIQAIAWPKPSPLGAPPSKVLVVEVEPATAGVPNPAAAPRELFLLSLAEGRAEAVPFARPSTRADLVDYLPGAEVSVFTANRSDGTFLWSSGGKSQAFLQRIALNEFLGEVAAAKRQLIEYRSVDGDLLKGLVLLPFGYEPGKRYPVVTWVYAGHIQRDIHYGAADTHNPSGGNLNLLTARGYVVLVPSMPLNLDGEASDASIDLPKGVLNAVDKLIDLGIADPHRLAVMGVSNGGYSTYSLITYTHRFQAAIALAGFSNLVSLYGVFDARFRYGDFPHEEMSAPAALETSWGRKGNAPWGDLWRYLRYSPLYYIDRVRTPLLIIQGDVDLVPLQQGEEFFTGLYRQGKRARFIRYWGEGHGINSPANIRHLWQQIYRWLEENGVPPGPSLPK